MPIYSFTRPKKQNYRKFNYSKCWRTVCPLFRNCTLVWCQQRSQSSSDRWCLILLQHEIEKELWDRTCCSSLCRPRKACCMKITLAAVRKWVRYVQILYLQISNIPKLYKLLLSRCKNLLQDNNFPSSNDNKQRLGNT